VKGLIFVVNSNDPERIGEAREELMKLMSDVPVIVFSNKKDMSTSLDVSEVAEKLGLRTLPNTINWHIQSTCVTSYDGLYEGCLWMVGQLKNIS